MDIPADVKLFHSLHDTGSQSELQFLRESGPHAKTCCAFERACGIMETLFFDAVGVHPAVAFQAVACAIVYESVREAHGLDDPGKRNY